MRVRVFAGLLAVAASLAATAPAAAQSSGGRLIEAARAQMENFEYDSAAVILERGLAADAGATMAERQRGLILYGIVALLRSNGVDRPGARQAFVSVLRLEPSYALADSLADMHSDVRIAFAEARQIVPLPLAAPVAAATVTLPVGINIAADTQLAVANGRYRIEALPSRRARVMVSVAPAAAPQTPVWADTATVDGSFTVSWDLRAGSALAPAGRYLLRVTATDMAGVASAPFERALTISRVPADTQPAPAPLDASSLLPETLTVRRGSPAVLALGLGLGAAAAVLPTALGNTQLNTGQTGDGTAIAVAGVASLAGIVGWLRGSRTRAAPENAARNAEAMRADAQRRADIATRNRAALDAAPVRVRVEP